MYGVYNETTKTIMEVFDTAAECRERIERYKVPRAYNPLLRDDRNDIYTVRELIDLYPDGGNGYAYKYLTDRYTSKDTPVCYRVEIWGWKNGSGYSYNEVFDHIKEYCDAETYIKSLDTPLEPVNGDDDLEVRIYLDDDEHFGDNYESSAWVSDAGDWERI